MRDGSDINTSGFEIGNVGKTHFLIANKFCFARPHLMLLTYDGYQRQFEPLHQNDLESTWAVLTAINRNYVAFYNCGQDGGCSRLHKHLQLIPNPKDSFAAFLDSKDDKEPNIPFQWFYHRFESEHVTPSELIQVYTNLLNQATKVGDGHSENCDNLPPGSACPHNMILTSQWMIVIPRRRAAINKEAGVNAIGMLGLISVATQKEMDNWVRLGLTDALRELGVPN
jgi:ATP adenylyltransferase/5',5'''-P-1,P-4-tetraphosphate phosphorylase II